MFSRTYVLAAAAVSVASLIENDIPDYMVSSVGVEGFRSDIIIQAPVANLNDIFLGEDADQSLFILPGGSSGLFKAELNNLFVRGTVGERVIIFLTF